MRRRRNRATWFPVLGVGDPGAQVTYDLRNFDFSAQPNVQAIPLIPDATPYVDTSIAGDHSLRDIVEGQTCLIERIVGKIVWGVDQFVPPGEPTPTTPNVGIFCTAFAVLPTDDAGSPAIPSDEYDPLLANNSAQPWLWRRTWVLANNQIAGLSDGGFNHPASNEFFASRDDGPHIDTKGTKRAIRREERIFMIHSTRSADNEVWDFNGASQVIADLRVLGMMVKAKNRSSFK